MVQNIWGDAHPQKTRLCLPSYFDCSCRFQHTFQSAIPKFVVNIPNYVSKFGILSMEVAKPTSQVAYLRTELLN